MLQSKKAMKLPSNHSPGFRVLLGLRTQRQYVQARGHTPWLHSPSLMCIPSSPTQICTDSAPVTQRTDIHIYAHNHTL